MPILLHVNMGRILATNYQLRKQKEVLATLSHDKQKKPIRIKKQDMRHHSDGRYIRSWSEL